MKPRDFGNGVFNFGFYEGKIKSRQQLSDIDVYNVRVVLRGGYFRTIPHILEIHSFYFQ